MYFSAQLFTIKRNLVFMNNLYNRVVVTSVGIALSFTLGAHKEARAATFILYPFRAYPSDVDSLYLLDRDQDGELDYGYIVPPFHYVGNNSEGEYRSYYKFNLASLFFNSDTVIESAVFQAGVNRVEYGGLDSKFQAYAHTVNSAFSVPFSGGEYLDEQSLSHILVGEQKIATFNILPFINQRRGNNNSFWFGIRRGESDYGDDGAFITLDSSPRLTITTFDPELVPEPTTIFGSAIGLCLGGWLKRRKSALQNKIPSQN